MTPYPPSDGIRPTQARRIMDDAVAGSDGRSVASRRADRDPAVLASRDGGFRSLSSGRAQRGPWWAPIRATSLDADAGVQAQACALVAGLGSLRLAAFRLVPPSASRRRTRSAGAHRHPRHSRRHHVARSLTSVLRVCRLDGAIGYMRDQCGLRGDQNSASCRSIVPKANSLYRGDGAARSRHGCRSSPSGGTLIACANSSDARCPSGSRNSSRRIAPG